jgi:hypothetical protein
MQDIEFILSNKVSHVINTVSRRIPNIWEKISVHYLSYNWTDNEQNVPVGSSLDLRQEEHSTQRNLQLHRRGHGAGRELPRAFSEC